jgi:hypothetical protein
VLTWLNGIVEDLVDGLNVNIRRRMKDDDDGTNQADSAAEFAQRPQIFVQKVGSKDCANKHTEGTQRRNKNSRRKGISSEVAHFSDDHYIRGCGVSTASHDRAQYPSIEERDLQVVMPAHHSGFLRYT